MAYTTKLNSNRISDVKRKVQALGKHKALMRYQAMEKKETSSAWHQPSTEQILRNKAEMTNKIQTVRRNNAINAYKNRG